MTEIWLYKWTSAMGETPDYFGKWAEMLFNLTMDQIKTGLDIEEHSDNEWPSPLPVFRKNCLTGAQSLEDLTSICIYWNYPDELKRRGLVKTKEGLYILHNADVMAIRTLPFEKAKKIVSIALSDMKKAIDNGYVLPEVPEEVPQVEHKKERVKFDLAEFMKAVNDGEEPVKL